MIDGRGRVSGLGGRFGPVSIIRCAVEAGLRAAMLGVGTIFQPKVRLDDHWSVSPKVEIVHAVYERSGDPPRPGLDELPDTV